MTTITVHGLPAPQGSKKAYVRNGRAILVESSAKVKPWRQAIIDATHHAPHYTQAVTVTITFLLPRPKHHFGTRQGQPYLKPTAPTYVITKPDIDKLARSTLDGLTDSGVLSDDNIVAVLTAKKRYVKDSEEPGAVIHIQPTEGTWLPAELRTNL